MTGEKIRFNKGSGNKIDLLPKCTSYRFRWKPLNGQRFQNDEKLENL